MSIPKYEKLFLPLLEFAGDEKEHSLSEAYDYIADRFDLSEKEKNKYFESGNDKILNNRVRWAKQYLKNAGLIEATKRAHFKITERGLKILENNPETIDQNFLKKFDEFQEWIEESEIEEEETEKDIEKGKSPEEVIDNKYKQLKNSLIDDLKMEIMDASPSFFEELVVDLIIEMGYGGSRKEAGEAIGGTGDEGIDGIIKEDRLGLEKIYVQAKRWQNNVGSREVREFIGALENKDGNKGILITTSNFTRSAKETAENNSKIVLINGDELAELMIENDLGVTTDSTYKIKDIDTDYFSKK